MAKRGYKLQEFVAHSTNVNCLSIGKKTSRLLITGGDDYKVNLWAIGKPTSLMSLCGHTSPVESVAFDSEEVLVVAGASTGVIKLWDLEEAKIVRALTGHRSNCTAFEFHPFGEFFASGSSDTNLKLWDIRKKGCIHTYRGHTRGISTIRFTPDGRWVVSGGHDNVVKVWDLTAGKLLHEFKFHEGAVRSLDFHPLEFLLATGSADGTVKYWDLETFELIGSSRPEATGVRTIAFHPDGRTLFCGLDDSLKVYSWEPVVRHDTVDMGWSTLGDLCINEGKVLACSYLQNSVGVWVADTSLIEPYKAGFTKTEDVEKEFGPMESHSLDKVGSGIRTTISSRNMSPDYDTKEIKNIYIDSSGGNSASSKNVELPSDIVKNITPTAEKPNSIISKKSLFVPSLVPQDNEVQKESLTSERESITFSKTKRGMLLRPAHRRKPKSDEAKQIVPHESGPKCEVDKVVTDLNLKMRNVSEERGRKPSDSEIESVVEKFDEVLSPLTPSDNIPSEKIKSVEPVSCSVESNSVKVVRGVKVVSGRTRSLVEKFERREGFSGAEDKAVTTTATPEQPIPDQPIPDQPTPDQPIPSTSEKSDVTTPDQPTLITPISVNLNDTTPVNTNPITQTQNSTIFVTPDQETSITRNYCVVTNRATSPDNSMDVPCRDSTSLSPNSRNNEETPSPFSRMFHGTSINATTMTQNSSIFQTQNEDSSMTRNYATTRNRATSPNEAMDVPRRHSPSISPVSRKNVNSTSPVSRMLLKNSTSPNSRNRTNLLTPDQPIPRNRASFVPPDQATTRPARNYASLLTSDRALMSQNKVSSLAVDQVQADSMRRNHASSRNTNRTANLMRNRANRMTNITPDIDREMDRNVIPVKEDPQISGREAVPISDLDFSENLMQAHDGVLSTLRSRLTKLQVVKHFWEQNDIKGAISAMTKLPDHAVAAEVISVLMEKMNIVSLDLFPCLLPVLTSLLDSKTERHATVSLEMLLKLVAVFGPVIRSTISAPRSVGVDLHAEQRLECCNECSKGLQRIRKILPMLTRSGGLISRKAQELSLVLQDS